MDARYYNGEPEAKHDPGRADGHPPRTIGWCADCPFKGDATAVVKHHHDTGHRIKNKHGMQLLFSELPTNWRTT